MPVLNDTNWETFTPPEPKLHPGGICQYNLTMYVDNRGGEGQEVSITRDEFIKLKNRLAEIRRWSPEVEEDYKELQPPIRCVQYRCNRFSLGADGPPDDATYLADTDGDGDWIYSIVLPAMLPG